MEEAKKNVHMAFIDYQKAFDILPNFWLLESMSMYKIDSEMINVLNRSMNIWRINIVSGNINKDINIKWGTNLLLRVIKGPNHPI